MEKRPVKVMETTVNIGVEKPFRVIHISDNHLTLADERDDQRKRDLATQRTAIFPRQNEVLERVKEIAKKENLPIVCTGDLIDFVSYANLDAAKKFMQETDTLFVAGNHEFSLYVGEAKEDEAYRNQSLAKVEAAFGGDVRFVSRIIDGVNFVGLDNGYLQFDLWQMERLQKEVEKGYPIVLFMHTPLYEKELFRVMMYDRASIGLAEQSPWCRRASLLGVKRELMTDYTPNQIEGQLPTEETLRVLEYINNCPAIKAILTGHVHCDYEAKATSGIPQIITSCTTVKIIQFR